MSNDKTPGKEPGRDRDVSKSRGRAPHAGKAGTSPGTTSRGSQRPESIHGRPKPPTPPKDPPNGKK
jgi:hypothetical protein